MIFLDLFFAFLKVGSFTFGGGYSAIALIRDVVLSYGWLGDEELTYMIAIAESTPGPIMVNLATYVGSSQAGFPGAVLATLAVVLPSFLIIILVTSILKTALKNRYVQVILQGFKPCIVGIILSTGVYMTLHHCFPLNDASMVDLRSCITAVLLFGISSLYQKQKKKKISPVLLISISALLGILIF